MNREAWGAAVHGVTKCQTELNWTESPSPSLAPVILPQEVVSWLFLLWLATVSVCPLELRDTMEAEEMGDKRASMSGSPTEPHSVSVRGVPWVRSNLGLAVNTGLLRTKLLLYMWLCLSLCAGAKSLQSCLILCDPLDCSLPGSSVHGILQARILEWIAMSSPGDLSNPGIEPMSPMSPSLTGGFFTTSATLETESKRNMWNVQNTPDRTLRNQRRKWTQKGSSREDAELCALRKWGKHMYWTQILPFPPVFVEGRKHISPTFLDSFLRSPPIPRRENVRVSREAQMWLSCRLSLFFSSPLISF